MKKLFSLVLAVAMVLSMASFASAEENTTLTIVAWDVGTTPYYQAQKEAFEATHPGVTIEYVDVASQDWDTKAGTMLSGGDTSDLFMVKQNINIMNWAQQGFAEPLTDYIAKDNYDLSGFVGMEPNYALDGTQYALPFRSDFWVLFYNKTLFDAAGVAYPTNDMTWEEYAALAKEMTGKGNCKYGCHYHTWRSAASLFSILDGKNTIIDGTYDFMKPTYDMVIAQQKDGICMDYGYLKTSSLHYSAAFENQQCAMVNMGSWFISTLEAYMKDAETKFNWGIVKYPHPAGAEAGSTLGTVTSLAINADSPKAEAAADFINWCVSEEGAQAIAKTGTFPACGSAATAEIIKSTEGFPEDSNSVDALTTSNVYLEMPYTQYASDIETILNAEHDAIMTMSETVDEGIQNMNDQVPAVLG